MAAAARTIEVVGLRDLRRELRRVSTEFPKELAIANQKAAEVVAKEARLRAPEGRHEGGGLVVPIKSSITVGRQQSRGVVSIGGARTPHGVVTEFGGTIPRMGSHRGQVKEAQAKHRGFRRYGGISVTHVRKQAYLIPALDAKRDEAVEVYNELVGDIMRRAFGTVAVA